MSEPTPAAAPQITGTAPYLRVADIGRAVDYWTRVLGFAVERVWGEPPCFAMPKRDGYIVMLAQPEPGCPPWPARPADDESWDVYIWVRDAEALFAEFTARGAIVAYPPTIRDFYEMKEFAVRDPDGHIIAFGQHWPRG
jgi:uncharacterized glyoxalase superfamily protein PhnB